MPARLWQWLLFLAAAVASAQAPEAWPLESLRIEGNQEFSAARILAAAGLKIGQAVAKADFDRARDRLLATGGFERVGYEYKPSAAQTGYDAVFYVDEVAPLYRYGFEALGPEATLREVLRKLEPLFEDRIPATPQVLNRFSQALGASLGGALVTGEVEPGPDGELRVLFRPAGERLVISEVRFRGNRAIRSEDLARAIASSAVGAPYSEALLRQMLDLSIRPLYEEQGRIRVAFPTVDVARSDENRGATVTVTVEEGPVYTLGEVEYRGLERNRVAELQRLAGFQKGEPANFKSIAEALARLRKQYREDGYLRVETPVERVLEDSGPVVNLVVAVKPGPRYTMGKLTINGLDILSEPVIRKMWQLQPGAPYRESYPDALLERIMAEGIFDNLDRTSAEAEIHDDTLTVDVTLTFLGARAAQQQRRR